MITITLLTFYDKYSWFPFSFGTANIITTNTHTYTHTHTKHQVNPKHSSSLLSFFWYNSCSSAIIFFLVMFLSSIFINLTSFDKLWFANAAIFIKFVLFNSSALWRSSAKPLFVAIIHGWFPLIFHTLEDHTIQKTYIHYFSAILEHKMYCND